ncbi:MAG: sodium:proton antiporter [Gemmatimonadales bacterium]|jgi:CPA1 family monovalent cation:H+ antiporter
MSLFDLLAVIVSVTALAAWVNHRFIRLPTTIGVMMIALVGSLVLVLLGRVGLGVAAVLERTLETFDFDAALLNGMLGALLFAGALHLDLNDLARQKRIIALLATVGVVVSTALVGVAAWGVFHLLGLGVPWGYCLLFGALISPTDPIAVGAILTKVGVPSSLQVKISGESLFNDGIGVVVFLLLLGIVTAEHDVTVRTVGELVLIEVVGGLAYGALIGWIAYRMLKSIDQYQVEILATLAIVTGGYALALHLHVSGPLAMVVAGLLIGNRGRSLAMSDRTRERLDSFWELVDEFLNAVLFVLIGVEVVVLRLDVAPLLAGLLMIPVVLGARFVSVGGAVQLLRRLRGFSAHAVKILTWSGLRGGISVALALSLPPGPERGTLLTATYVIVCFSIVVQGLTVGPLVRRLYGRPASDIETGAAQSEAGSGQRP